LFDHSEQQETEVLGTWVAHPSAWSLCDFQC